MCCTVYTERQIDIVRLCAEYFFAMPLSCQKENMSMIVRVTEKCQIANYSPVVFMTLIGTVIVLLLSLFAVSTFYGFQRK